MISPDDKRNVFVIDESNEFTLHLKRLFKNWKDINIEQCDSAEVAEQWLSDDLENLYLLDFDFNNKKSLQLLKRSRMNGGISPVIIFSKKDRSIAEKVLDAGSVDYFNLPQISDAEIKSKVLNNLKVAENFQRIVKSELRYRNMVESLPVMLYLSLATSR